MTTPKQLGRKTPSLCDFSEWALGLAGIEWTFSTGTPMALCFMTKSVANTPYVLAIGEQCLQSIKTFCLPTLHPRQAGDRQQVGREHEHNSWPKLTQKDKANQTTSHSAIRTGDLVFPTQPLFWDWPGISLLVDSGEWLLMNHLGLFRTLSFTSTVFISNHKYFTFALPILPLSLLRGGVSKWLDGCPVAGECQIHHKQ